MPLIIRTEGHERPIGDMRGRILLDALRAGGVAVETRCGGRGVCASCTVVLEEGHYRIFGETVVLGEHERKEALACQTFVESEHAVVSIPHRTLLRSEGARIVDDMRLPMYNHQPGRGMGVAVDIGTTTVVALLVDMATGRPVARAARFNQQILKADDVASRISYCSSPERLKTMQTLITRRTIDPMLEEICVEAGVPTDSITGISVAGNTVMGHLLHGVSPESIGRLPFIPTYYEFPPVKAGAVGLRSAPDADLYLLPAISGYVGGDIVGDMLTSGFDRRKGVHLLIDIGTNGEMVLNENGRLFAAATAAGPAFEGAGLMHGCRAIPGAIDHMEITVDGDLRASVIGGDAPLGVCGSGVVDFLAAARRGGWLNRMGRFDVARLDGYGRGGALVWNGRPTRVCRLMGAGKDAVLISEADVAQVLKAKAAMYAGIKALLDERGLKPSALERVVLAGGFAKHLDLKNTVEIGLLPELPLDRFEVIGNGSLAGALVTLTDSGARDACRVLRARPEIVELNLTRRFADYFAEAMALPYFDREEFPCVERQFEEEA